MPLLLLLTLGAAGFIGWSIGANDAANCVGATVGCRRISLKQAILITCSFVGAILLGHRVIKTIGKGIVPLDQLDPHLSFWIALCACFSAGFWVLFSTYLKLPVSTSHSTVGAIFGVGLIRGRSYRQD